MLNNKEQRPIILASTSPRRKELIASLHLAFEVIPSHADEHTPPDWTPEQTVQELAMRKALAVYRGLEGNQQESIIVGSDTIVVLDNEILGKPVDAADAERMLSRLQGREHRVFTGVACIDAGTGHAVVQYRQTDVTMKELSEATIRAYVQTGEPSDKAGSYAIQGIGASLIDRIEGCYFNVVGLPLSLLSDMLEGFGVYVLSRQ
ncbi:septum formation inhibitor Maf [Paenibacillus barcinonensis]|uniref:dTTP/UTP pyrophosphatase n=1 Tax=Paenibacillus barcinonensis TaxID=198119 RepID=A0A2V4VZV8_PAEBA|nr:Maf family protein [Paenibacillus barcinonensis]PYE44445.1 septum formation protein [Paenibacillus barcinonensis]QKS56787.1 septum formation inhibitor Maf [Paenibacillus barcinonensis]